MGKSGAKSSLAPTQLVTVRWPPRLRLSQEILEEITLDTGDKSGRKPGEKLCVFAALINYFLASPANHELVGDSGAGMG